MSRREKFTFAAILAVFFLVQLGGLFVFGLTDDDDFYIPAGISYATWLKRALTLTSLTRSAIDEAFRLNNEHPPFAKYVFGTCQLLFKSVLGPFRSARLGTVLFATLGAACILRLCFRHLPRPRGLLVGGFACLSFLTLPRFFFHSHAATLDVPVASMYLLTATLVLEAERNGKAAILAGLAFGLATATKLNAPFLLLAYVPFVILTRYRPIYFRGEIQVPKIPLPLITMATLGPMTFFAIWPWMWFDTVSRVGAYIAFHAKHYGIHFLYFGTIHSDKPFAPWHAPFVMAASTVPTPLLIMAFFAVLGSLGPIRSRLRDRTSPDSESRREADLLLFVLLNAVTTIGLVAFAGTPIYGGEKLFMPFFPFLCILAAYGIERALSQIADLIPRFGSRIALGCVIAGSGCVPQMTFGEYALSYYNAVLGGLPGATSSGMERQYYDVAFTDLVRHLSREGPANLKVHFLPNNWEYIRTYRWYRDDGLLRDDIQVTDRPEQADWIVITHERRFARYTEDVAKYRTLPVLEERRIGGVPIWTMYDAKRRN